MNTKTENLKIKALGELETLLKSISAAGNDKKAQLIAYWLCDYCKYITKEDSFDYSKLKKYKRGDVVKVDFGFRLGSEHGGLHYAIVVDNNNSIYSSIITVIPLGSQGNNSGKTHRYNVQMGTILHDRLSEKVSNSTLKLEDILNAQISDKLPKEAEAEIFAELDKLKKVKGELENLKRSSVALVSQITTISKIRIVNPTSTMQSLQGIRLTPEEIQLIDNKIKELFLYSPKQNN